MNAARQLQPQSGTWWLWRGYFQAQLVHFTLHHLMMMMMVTDRVGFTNACFTYYSWVKPYDYHKGRVHKKKTGKNVVFCQTGGRGGLGK